MKSINPYTTVLLAITLLPLRYASPIKEPRPGSIISRTSGTNDAAHQSTVKVAIDTPSAKKYQIDPALQRKTMENMTKEVKKLKDWEKFYYGANEGYRLAILYDTWNDVVLEATRTVIGANFTPTEEQIEKCRTRKTCGENGALSHRNLLKAEKRYHRYQAVVDTRKNKRSLYHTMY